MATPYAGINGMILVDVGAGLVELPLMKDWTADQTRERFDSTAMGDTSKSSNAGLPDYKGTWNGFVDKDDDAAWSLADGAAHEFIVYADRNATAGHRHYDRGYGVFDVQTKGGTGSNVEVTITVTAQSPGVQHYLV